MGTFAVPIEIGDRLGERWEHVEALVDTGATYTQLPPDVLERLGIQPTTRDEFETADGRVVERNIGWATVRWDGREGPTLVLFGEPGSPRLLGAHALESLRLAADPARRRLVPARGLLL